MVSKRVDRKCKQCGSDFWVYRSALEKSNTSGNFCSRKCYNEYQKTLTGSKNNHYTRVEKECPTCGKKFLALPSKIKMYKNVFCSVKCRGEYMKYYTGGEKNTNWKGGESRYRGNFDEVKRKHFSGTQFCAICGTTKGIHIHHIIPYRLSQDNSVDNLIPLCRRHHKKIESMSLDFIELFDDDTYEIAKMYMNNILRSAQMATATVLKEVANG